MSNRIRNYAVYAMLIVAIVCVGTLTACGAPQPKAKFDGGSVSLEQIERIRRGQVMEEDVEVTMPASVFREGGLQWFVVQ